MKRLIYLVLSLLSRSKTKCDCCLMTKGELEKQYREIDPKRVIKFKKVKEFNVCSECLKDTSGEEILQDLIYCSIVSNE